MQRRFSLLSSRGRRAESVSPSTSTTGMRRSSCLGLNMNTRFSSISPRIKRSLTRRHDSLMSTEEDMDEEEYEQLVMF
jgi:hypothetical protein